MTHSDILDRLATLDLHDMQTELVEWGDGGRYVQFRMPGCPQPLEMPITCLAADHVQLSVDAIHNTFRFILGQAA